MNYGKMYSIEWISAYWDLTLVVIATALAGCVIMLRLFHWGLGSSFIIRPSVERLSILLLLGSLSLHAVREHSNPTVQLERTLQSAEMYYGPDWNPYIRERINDSVRELIEGLKTQQAETHAMYTAQTELERAIRASRQGDIVLAIDYGFDWARTFSKYHQENVDACRNGVKVTRVFMITPRIQDWSAEQKDNLLNVMRQQANAGCTVLIGHKPDLDKALAIAPQNSTYTVGQVMFLYGDSSSKVIFVEETSPDEANPDRPYLVRVMWGNNKVKTYEEVYKWLTSPQTGVVKKFDPSQTSL